MWTKTAVALVDISVLQTIFSSYLCFVCVCVCVSCSEWNDTRLKVFSNWQGGNSNRRESKSFVRPWREGPDETRIHLHVNKFTYTCTHAYFSEITADNWEAISIDSSPFKLYHSLEDPAIIHLEKIKNWSSICFGCALRATSGSEGGDSTAWRHERHWSDNPLSISCPSLSLPPELGTCLNFILKKAIFGLACSINWVWL